MPALYPSFKEQLLQAGINLATADVRAILVDQADEAYNAADVFLSDVTSAGIVGTSVTLSGKTLTAGVFDANDVTFNGVTGDSVEAVILYVHNASATAARLIGYFDGISVTPNGGSIIITWSDGANKIFAL